MKNKQNQKEQGFEEIKDIHGKTIRVGDYIKDKNSKVYLPVEYGEYHQIGSDSNPKYGLHMGCYGIYQDDIEQFGLEIIPYFEGNLRLTGYNLEQEQIKNIQQAHNEAVLEVLEKIRTRKRTIVQTSDKGEGYTKGFIDALKDVDQHIKDLSTQFKSKKEE
jgi:hypothetical protein